MVIVWRKFRFSGKFFCARGLRTAGVLTLSGVLAWVLAPWPSHADSTPVKGLSGSAEVAFTTADVRGFLQIPAGGVPGTSSLRRPTLGEIGADAGRALRLDLTIERALWSVRLAAQRNNLRGSAELQQLLRSQALSFAAAERVVSGTTLDLWGLDVGRELQWRSLVLRPAIGVSHFRLDYHLRVRSDSAARSTSENRARRNFSRTALAGSIELELPLGGGVSLAAKSLRTVRLSPNTHDFNAVEVAARWAPGALTGDRRELAIVLAIGRERFDYADEQPLPNQLRLRREPYVALGLRLDW